MVSDRRSGVRETKSLGCAISAQTGMGESMAPQRPFGDAGSAPADRRPPRAISSAVAATGARQLLRGMTFAAIPALVLGLAACTASHATPQDDEEKLVQATLRMLSGRGEPLCVDATTVGQPLSVFRTLTTNPPPGAAPPVWFLPARFGPPVGPSGADLVRSAQAEGTVHIDQPTNSTLPVATPAQAMLDRAASRLAVEEADRTVTITPSWQPGIKARWWPRNRISRHCSPTYHISNPVRARDIGFVSVTGDHWGTTYAFKRSGADWVARAQWTNWLY